MTELIPNLMPKLERKPGHSRFCKGFVFSTDALLSIVVISITLAAVSFFASRTYPDNLSLVNLQLKTNDMLVVLDKLDYLSGMDASATESFLDDALGGDVKWALNTEYYVYTIVDGERSFVLDRTLDIGNSSDVSGDIATANRVFVVKNSTDVIYYGRVVLQSWVRR